MVQFSISTLAIGIVQCALVLSVGHSLGVIVFLPSSMLLLSTVCFNSRNLVVQITRDLNCSWAIHISFLLSIILPCATFEITIHGTSATLNGGQAIMYAFFFLLIQLESIFLITDLNFVDLWTDLPYTFTSISILCSIPTAITICFRKWIMNMRNWIKSLIAVVIMASSAGTWLIPLVHGPDVLCIGFYFWVAAINIQFFSWNFSNFELTILFLYVFLPVLILAQ